jgi:uncharacterized protein YyaL (SSP411 family)
MKQLKNLLSEETSPYLLQHASNPVEWQSWNDNPLQFAKDNNKLLLISIGYSACHWCHVMEEECFEDHEVAELMNTYFVNIKVDREERPDVDHLYMSALQIMTGYGGWPLNIIALPDGRPVWGATYLPKKKWMGVLHQLKDLFAKAPDQMEDYAEKLSAGIKQLNTLVKVNNEDHNFDKDFLNEKVKSWQQNFDWKNGGFKGAPKFMMPNSLSFLLEYGVLNKHQKILDFIELSLTKMAQGGIYDALGGGFSRYSVDEKWHVPHFEKMLYDNAQLIELYSNAYAVFKNEKFKKVVRKTINFIERELTAEQGYFYAALDADSLNTQQKKEEGAFYCWNKEELKEILKDDFELFAAYFNINATGYWEEKKYVLFQTKTEDEIATSFSISTEALQQKIQQAKEKLFTVREQRARPSLDDKGLTAWNAQMIKAYAKAYQIFQQKEYLKRATRALQFINDELLDEEGKLYRSYKKQKTIPACLEDYALLIDTLLEVYQSNFEVKHLLWAKELTQTVIKDFYNEESGLFFYTSNQVKLIQRSTETQDNVIPASNSVMANNLFKLSKYFQVNEWSKISEEMLATILPNITNYYSGYSNWMALYAKFSQPFYEVVITGNKPEKAIKKLQQHYLSNNILAVPDAKLQLTHHKKSEELHFFVCRNNYCEAPEKNFQKVLKLLKFEV